MVTKRAINKEVFEKNIVKAAKKIIKKNGLAGLNARNVAEEAGCAVGTIYNVFRNMNELILKINGETLLLMRDELTKSLEVVRKNQSLGRVLAKFYIGFADTYTPFWNLLFEFKYAQDKKLPKWYEEIIENNFLLIEKAIAPLLPDDAKMVKEASRVLWAGFHGIVMLSMSGKLSLGSKEIPERLSESLFENYIKGISK